jgi:long-chain acyl-CoA synthetase
VVALLGPEVFQPRLMFDVGPFDFQTRDDPGVLPGIVARRSEGLPDMKKAIERRAGERPPPVAPTSDVLAYIVYTSGATRRPKGAQLLHRNALDGAAIYQQVFDAGPGARDLGMTPLFHVTGLVSQSDLSFSVGGCLIQSYLFDQAVMVHSVREHGATHCWARRPHISR